VARFPTVRALARARPDRVLARGRARYYRRRVNARGRGIVCGSMRGAVPSDPARSERCRVGRYTLGAVLSIGFGTPLPVLDGNVARVLARSPRDRFRSSARPTRERCGPWPRRCCRGPGRPATRRAAAGRQETPPGAARRVRARAGPPIRRLEPGAHGTRRHRVHTARPPLRRVPRTASLRALRSAGRRVSRLLPSGARPSAPPGDRRARAARAYARRAAQGSVARRPVEPPGTGARPRTFGRSGARPAPPDLARLGFRARITDTGGRLTHVITHRSITVEVWRAELIGEPPRASFTHAGPSGQPFARAQRRWRGASSTARPGPSRTAPARRCGPTRDGGAAQRPDALRIRRWDLVVHSLCAAILNKVDARAPDVQTALPVLGIRGASMVIPRPPVTSE